LAKRTQAVAVRLGQFASRVFTPGSSSANPMSTAMLRTRSRCCARAASGHAAAPSSVAKNFRRPCPTNADRGAGGQSCQARRGKVQ
jgi:hypothetical protein